AAARAAWLATVRSLSTDFVERSADYRRAIATLDLPVLLVHGRQDPAVPAAHCAETAEGFARATVRWLDACGHFPHIEHAQVVNGWLADFLVGRPAPRWWAGASYPRGTRGRDQAAGAEGEPRRERRARA